jgi:hypothetical protein
LSGLSGHRCDAGLEKPVPATGAGTTARNKALFDVRGFSDAKRLPAEE